MSELYLGSVCKRGHDGRRYRKSGDCVDCARGRSSTVEFKVYKRTYQKIRHLSLVKYIRSKKEGQICADCGQPHWPEVLDFDHRPGTKKLFRISSPRTRTIVAIDAEMAKCDLVCANCHRYRTIKRRGKK